MEKHRVIYMETDPADGLYKNHIAASQGGGYSNGELFITAPGSKPFDTYEVRAYHGEALYYEKIKRVVSRDDGSHLYRLTFGNPRISAKFPPIYFRAYPLNTAESTSLYAWILFELMPTPTILDTLEEEEGYNLVGDEA